MATIFRLPERPERKRERLFQSQQTLGLALRYPAFSKALTHVLKHHPEAETAQEQFDLALDLTIRSFYAAAKNLADNPPILATNLKSLKTLAR